MFTMDKNEETEFSPPGPAPAPKKRGPKRKAKRMQAKHIKQRGLYKARQGKGFVSAEDDADLLDCLFSDDEAKEEFIVNASEASDVTTSDTGASDSVSLSSVEISDSSCGSFVLSPDAHVSSASESSRPSSSCSRPASALSTEQVKKVHLDLSHTLANSAAEIESVGQESTTSANEVISESCDPTLEEIQSGLAMFKNILPPPWIAIADRDGFHLLLISSSTPKAIQREIFISFNGNVLVLIHCKLVPGFKELFKISDKLVAYSAKCIQEFCQNGLSLVAHFLRFKICVGANDLDTRSVWDKVQDTFIDLNAYKESDYSATCRSVSCLMLVEVGHGLRCAECAKILKNIRRRKAFLLSDTVQPTTNNKNLTLPQALKKLEKLHDDIRKKDKQIAYLKSRISKLIEDEGVNIDADTSESFSKILMDNPNLTEVQRMFLTEQWAYCNKSDGRAHRWHPTMIRFALSIYMGNPGSYERMRDLGVLRLPHSRTLFNYTHSVKAKGGINEELVNLVQEKVQSFEEPCKQYHVLLCDGMHVSQNLVFRESDGTLVGFTHIDDIDKELERMENYVVGKEAVSSERMLATEVVAFLVKGMATNVKCVIASYAIKVMTKEMLYKRSWDVIRHLEAAGIKVLAFVCDGHPVNRAFFKMHVPDHGPTKFDCIYSTFNFCAPEERPLFFVSDVCHLLKTLRNSFYNSGEGEKKPRLLELNGEKIVWKHIIHLYLKFKENNLRKSCKLNAQNVFPNSYSKMKVRYAAQILSATLAQDLEDQEWPETKETVKFIRNCNKFFDCLNGAFSTQGKRKRNNDLDPYTAETVKEDQRFVWLDSFIDYLHDWKKQVDGKPIPATSKEKMMLPIQTMLGVEMSIKGIQGATTYFLDPEKGNGKFLNARVFSQDPLEQHFGVQRCGRGGSRNPNVSQFEQKQVAVALHREIGVRKRKANSSEAEVGLQLSNDPVPRLKRTRKV
ncbi:DNA transposase [Frankliniella fusca]|uniref:DNA transposase n=1 Tax=Frankliniella fusca TaxID=407009 RepID=A0AAE1HP69_9NEOP|nr:DNA transposase [Frankliniella fusca]